MASQCANASASQPSGKLPLLPSGKCTHVFSARIRALHGIPIVAIAHPQALLPITGLQSQNQVQTHHRRVSGQPWRLLHHGHHWTFKIASRPRKHWERQLPAANRWFMRQRTAPTWPRRYHRHFPGQAFGKFPSLAESYVHRPLANDFCGSQVSSLSPNQSGQVQPGRTHQKGPGGLH